MTAAFDATRRSALGAVLGLAAAAPAFAAGPADTPVQALWRRAESLRRRLEAHRAELAANAREGGVSSWMYADGEAYRLGEARYDALVDILNGSPRDADDLAIMAKASADAEILNGPRSWAAGQLARAAVALHA